MDIRRITPAYAVSPQISPEDLPEIAAAGFRTVLCNRPDTEVPVELQAQTIGIATEAAGLAFHVLPLVHDTLPDTVPAQMQILSNAEGPVLAYCASGTRCSIAWSLGQAGLMPTPDIIAATAAVGYDLAALAPQIEALAQKRRDAST